MEFNTAFTLPRRLAFWDACPLRGRIAIVLPCRHRPFVMECDNDDTVVKTLHWAGFFSGWEPASLRLWAGLAATAERVFDIGAYTGIYGLLAATCSGSSRVACVEGCGRNHARLVHNVSINGLADRITCLHAVAVRASGPAVLHERYAADGILSSVHSMTRAGGEPIAVDGIAADDLAARLGWAQPDLVKIDVEGAEPEVLAGMRRSLADAAPDILLEANSGAALARSLAEMPAGYRCFAIDEQALAVHELSADVIGVDRGRNYLLTVRHAASDLAAMLVADASR